MHIFIAGPAAHWLGRASAAAAMLPEREVGAGTGGAGGKEEDAGLAEGRAEGGGDKMRIEGMWKRGKE